jgi:hypothetical protein
MDVYNVFLFFDVEELQERFLSLIIEAFPMGVGNLVPEKREDFFLLLAFCFLFLLHRQPRRRGGERHLRQNARGFALPLSSLP